MNKAIKIALVIGAAVAAFFILKKTASPSSESSGGPGGLQKVGGAIAKILSIAGKALKTLGAPVAGAATLGAGIAATTTIGVTPLVAGVAPSYALSSIPAMSGAGSASAGAVSGAPISGAGAVGGFSALGASIGAAGAALWIGGAIKALKSLFSSGWWEGTPQEIAERKAWLNATRAADAKIVEMNITVGTGKATPTEW
jgi:hypothetical protein